MAAVAAAAAASVSPLPLPLRFHPVEKYFYRGEERFPGLLHLLSDRFYPHYDYTKAKHNLEHTDVTEYKQRQTTQREIKSNVREKGIKVGIRFDKEMVQSIALLNQHPDLPMRVIWDAPYRKTYSNLPPAISSLCNGLMPQTIGFWRKMQARGLLPVDAQVCVGKWYATAVDVVCVNTAGEHILIEAKCGFSGYYRKCTTHTMKAPLQAQTDALFNQWQLQLAAAKELYEATFPEEKVGECLVVRMEGAKAFCYKLKPWAKAIQSWSDLMFPNGPGTSPIATSQRDKKKKKQQHQQKKTAGINRKRKSTESESESRTKQRRI